MQKYTPIVNRYGFPITGEISKDEQLRIVSEENAKLKREVSELKSIINKPQTQLYQPVITAATIVRGNQTCKSYGEIKNKYDSKAEARFSITTNSKKVSMEEIFNQPIIVHAYQINRSKFKDNVYVTILFEHNGEQKFVFTGSGNLIRSLRAIDNKDFPFITRICKDKDTGKYYFDD